MILNKNVPPSQIASTISPISNKMNINVCRLAVSLTTLSSLLVPLQYYTPFVFRNTALVCTDVQRNAKDLVFEASVHIRYCKELQKYCPGAELFGRQLEHSLVER